MRTLFISATIFIFSLVFSSIAHAQNARRLAPDSLKNAPFDPHDLSGVWWGVLARGANFGLGGTIPPMTPWAEERYKAAKPGLGGSGRAQPLGNDPMMNCDPMGFPRIMFWTNYPIEIVQLPKRTMMFFDWFYTYRTIWTDGRKLPEDPEPRWYGNSVGQWEGDTFVVRSTGFDDRTWLDADGHPHSEDMKLEERYRRVDHNTIEITMTLTDSKAFTKPWLGDTMSLRLADSSVEMREDVCVPSEEQRYKELIRNPAGGATKPN